MGRVGRVGRVSRGARWSGRKGRAHRCARTQGPARALPRRREKMFSFSVTPRWVKRRQRSIDALPPHAPSTNTLDTYLVPLTKIETTTGLEFLERRTEKGAFWYNGWSMKMLCEVPKDSKKEDVLKSELCKFFQL